MNNDTNKPLDPTTEGLGLPPIPSTGPTVPPPPPTSTTTTTTTVSEPLTEVSGGGLPPIPSSEQTTSPVTTTTTTTKVEPVVEMGGLPPLEPITPLAENKPEGEKPKTEKPKKKISKRAVIAGIIAAVVLSVVGVTAYQFQKFTGEQRGRACQSCGGGTCPDGWSYGPDTCAPQATCAQRAAEACSGHQGGGGTPTPTGTGGGGRACNGSSTCSGVAAGQCNAGYRCVDCACGSGTNAYACFQLDAVCGSATICTPNAYDWGGTTLRCRHCNAAGTAYTGQVADNLCAGHGTPTATATTTAAPTSTVTATGTPSPCPNTGLSCLTGSGPSGYSLTCLGAGGATTYCCASGQTIVGGACSGLISSSGDGVGGCCNPGAHIGPLEGCGPGSTCTVGNGACASGVSCTDVGGCGTATNAIDCANKLGGGQCVWTQNQGGNFVCGVAPSSCLSQQSPTGCGGISGCFWDGASCKNKIPNGTAGCCGSRTDCPSGQACSISNGACASGTSCGGSGGCITGQCMPGGAGATCPGGMTPGTGTCSGICCTAAPTGIGGGGGACNNLSGTCRGRSPGDYINASGGYNSGSPYCTCRQASSGSCYCEAAPGITPTAAPTAPAGGCAGPLQSCNSAACCTGQNLVCQGTSGNLVCQQTAPGGGGDRWCADTSNGGGTGGLCNATKTFHCTQLTNGQCLDNQGSAPGTCGQTDQVCNGSSGGRSGQLCGGFTVFSSGCGAGTTTTPTTTPGGGGTPTPTTTAAACVNTRIFINGGTTAATAAQMNAIKVNDKIRMVVMGNNASLVGAKFIVKIGGADVSNGGFLVTTNLTPIQSNGVREFYYDYTITQPGSYTVDGYVNSVPPSVTATPQPTGTVGAWNGPINISALPGSGDMQTSSSFVLGSDLIQGFWRGNQGFNRTVPIVNGAVQFGQANVWSAPIAMTAWPAASSGAIQGLTGYVLGNTLTQGVWRGNQGWSRSVPIVNGVAQYSQASAWSGPLPITALPGSGDMQTSHSVVVGSNLIQTYWRGDKGYSRVVPIVNNAVQFGQASSWSTPADVSVWPGSGAIQSLTSYTIGNTLTQGVWRGNAGYSRQVTITNNVVTWPDQIEGATPQATGPWTRYPFPVDGIDAAGQYKQPDGLLRANIFKGNRYWGYTCDIAASPVTCTAAITRSLTEWAAGVTDSGNVWVGNPLPTDSIGAFSQYIQPDGKLRSNVFKGNRHWSYTCNVSASPVTCTAASTSTNASDWGSMPNANVAWAGNPIPTDGSFDTFTQNIQPDGSLRSNVYKGGRYWGYKCTFTAAGDNVASCTALITALIDGSAYANAATVWAAPNQFPNAKQDAVSTYMQDANTLRSNTYFGGRYWGSTCAYQPGTSQVTGCTAVITRSLVDSLTSISNSQALVPVQGSVAGTSSDRTPFEILTKTLITTFKGIFKSIN